MTGPCAMILTVPITWNLKGIVTLDVLFGPAVMTVMLSAVRLGVVDAAALPWCSPVATKEVLTWDTGRVEEAKMVTPAMAVS